MKIPQPFESIWSTRNGLNWYERAKPLAVEETWPLVDGYGAFAGLVAGLSAGPTGITFAPSADQQEGALLPNKCWQFVNGGRAGSVWGRSRFENFRETAWRPWLDAAKQLFKLGDKISGIMPIFRVPAGEFPDGKGGTVNYVKDAQQTGIPALKRGLGLVLPNLAGLVKPGMTASDIVKLIEASSSSIDIIDFGENTPAIMGFLSEMEHYEGLMDEGMLLSPRVGRESNRGGRADAEQHTETGIKGTKRFCTNFDTQVSKSIGNQFLELNFGPEARDSVWLVSMLRDDADVQNNRKFILQLGQANKDVAARTADFVDMNERAKAADLVIRQKWEETPVPQSESDLPVDGNVTGTEQSATTTNQPSRIEKLQKKLMPASN